MTRVGDNFDNEDPVYLKSLPYKTLNNEYYCMSVCVVGDPGHTDNKMAIKPALPPSKQFSDKNLWIRKHGVISLIKITG